MSEPEIVDWHSSSTARARRLCAELENSIVEARAIGLHIVADSLGFARDILLAAALSRFSIDLKKSPPNGDTALTQFSNEG